MIPFSVSELDRIYGALVAVVDRTPNGTERRSLAALRSKIVRARRMQASREHVNTHAELRVG